MWILKRWKWILGAIFLIGLLLFNEGSRNYWQKRKYYKKLKGDIVELQQKNSTMEKELERLKRDPEYLANIARRELGMIRPNELEYQFVVQNSTP